MSVVLAISFLGLTYLFGWLVTTIVRVTAPLEKVGLSFLFGSWLMTLEMMIAYQFLNYFSPVITTGLVLVSISICSVIIWWQKSLREQLLSEIETLRRIPQFIAQLPTLLQKNLSIKDWVFVILITAVLLPTALSNFVWPVTDWDAIALYDFRALLIKLVGHWQDGKALGYFYHYPPYTSLFHGALYQLGFERVKIVYTVLFASFLCVFYALLRRKVSQTQALLGTFLLTIAPLLWGHITMAYTNLPYTIYFSLSLLYAWDWLAGHRQHALTASFLLMMGSVWVRQSEPFWIVIFLLLVLGKVFVNRRVSWLFFGALVLLFLASFQYWPWYVRTLHLPPPIASTNDAAGLLVPVNFGRIVWHGFLVTDHYMRSVLQPILLLLLPSIIFLFFDQKKMKDASIQIAVFTIFVFFALVFMGTYYFSFTYKTWHLIGESLTRMVMFIVPLFIFILSQSSFWESILQSTPQKRRSRTK